MWFGKAVQDFNSSVQAQNQGLNLVADVGNAFTSKCSALRRSRRDADLCCFSDLGCACVLGCACHDCTYQVSRQVYVDGL